MPALLLGRLTLIAACLGPADGARVTLPPSRLAVRDGTAWTEWWNSTAAPHRYASATPALAPRVSWKAGAAGSTWGELELSGVGEAWRTRVIVVRLDPRRVRLALDTAFVEGSAAWSLDRVAGANTGRGAGVVAAFNAGQFGRSLPWGWVQLNGARFLRPSIAPLVSTFTVAAGGAVQLVHGTLPDTAGVQWAFQSYPTLLNAGDVPLPLRQADCGVDVAHRDARLALGLDAEGRLLIAMTRFDGMGTAFDRAPFGLTTPEMAAVMGALGASDAVLLDGGISAQLLVRDAAGKAHQWPGVRKVPLALVAYQRPRAASTAP